LVGYLVLGVPGPTAHYQPIAAAAFSQRADVQEVLSLVGTLAVLGRS
jgi:hypothetical protein